MKVPFALKAIAGLSTMFMASACGYGDYFPRPPGIVYRNWGIVTPPPPDDRRMPYRGDPSQPITVYPDRNLPPREHHAEDDTPPEPEPPPPVQTYNKPEPGTGLPVPLLRTPRPSS